MTQLQPNLFVQKPLEHIPRIIFEAGGYERARVAGGLDRIPAPPLVHVVNPFRAPPDSEHAWVQPMVLEAMARSRDLAPAGSDIRFVAAVYPDETDVVPDGFTIATPHLRRMVRDRTGGDRRRLPLVFDILDRAARMAPPGAWLVFTNIDILVMPFFYQAVQELLRFGFDAAVINRRAIVGRPGPPEERALLWADIGHEHGGFDCFVFPAAWAPRFHRTDSAIGIQKVMQPLLYNLVALAQRMVILRAAHLTTHIGFDAPPSEAPSPLEQHNLNAVAETFQALVFGKLAGQEGADRLCGFMDHYWSL